jgi:uncharacterized protein (TIGR02996 family)
VDAEGAFWAQIEAASDDPASRLVFADWLEDHGRPAAAECLRWLVRHRKRPQHIEAPLGDSWGWLRDLRSPAVTATHGAMMLPDRVFDRLKGGKGFLDVARFYRSRRAAEEALLAAWAKARAAGWQPDG